MNTSEEKVESNIITKKSKKTPKHQNIIQDTNKKTVVAKDPLESKKSIIQKTKDVLGVKKIEEKKRQFKSFHHVDKKLKSITSDTNKENKKTKAAKKDVQILLTEDDGYMTAEGTEKTYNYSQEKLKQDVDINTQKRIFNLQLTQFGPYLCQYNREGSSMLIAGKKGHLAVINAFSHRLTSEINVKETIRDIKFLHDDMYAVAQKKYLYIYDHMGTELHCLRNFKDVQTLEYLPYHFLLVNSSRHGMIAWQDISTGSIVTEHPSKLGEATCLRQNPYNAIVHAGYSNGQVALWSPNQSKPLARMLCHHGAITSLAVDPTGHYMVTTGMDSQMNIWDLRTYKLFSAYYTNSPAVSIDISQKGLISCATNGIVNIWKDCLIRKQKSIYMRERYPSICQCVFRPFQDQLMIGHNEGISSMIIPGAGEANYDTNELNIYNNYNSKQRKENLVQKLLDKLPADTIVLDPNSLF